MNHLCLLCFKMQGSGSKKEIALSYITASKYGKACRFLSMHSKAFKRDLKKHIQVQTAAEISRLCSPTTQSMWRSSEDKLKRYRNFSWKKALNEAKRECPYLYAAVSGAASKHQRIGQREVPRHLRPAMGAIFALLAFMREPSKMKLLQEMIGLELWLSNCGHEVRTVWAKSLHVYIWKENTVPQTFTTSLIPASLHFHRDRQVGSLLNVHSTYIK